MARLANIKTIELYEKAADILRRGSLCKIELKNGQKIDDALSDGTLTVCELNNNQVLILLDEEIKNREWL